MDIILLIGHDWTPHQFMGRLSYKPRDGTCTAAAAGPRKAPFRQMAFHRRWGPRVLKNAIQTVFDPQM